MLDTFYRLVAVYAVPCLFAITMHEAAHGLVARWCGDRTATYAGRVTLNPLPHVDPLGTLILPGLMLLGGAMSGAGAAFFGWAKPVPVNYARLRNPRRDVILVSLAGPGANLLQAVFWLLLLLTAVPMLPSEAAARYVLDLCRAGMGVNVALLAFNLIPLPPLDGGRVVEALLPWRMAQSYAQLERWGFLIVIALAFSGALGWYLRPFYAAWNAFSGAVFGLF